MGNPNTELGETDPIVEESSREIKIRQGLLTAPISFLEPRKPVTLPLGATVAEAVSIMNREKIGAILIVDPDDGRLLGIFTERDVLSKIAGHGFDFARIHVADYMTPDPECRSMNDFVAWA